MSDSDGDMVLVPQTPEPVVDDDEGGIGDDDGGELLDAPSRRRRQRRRIAAAPPADQDLISMEDTTAALVHYMDANKMKIASRSTSATQAGFVSVYVPPKSPGGYIVPVYTPKYAKDHDVFRIVSDARDEVEELRRYMDERNFELFRLQETVTKQICYGQMQYNLLVPLEAPSCHAFHDGIFDADTFRFVKYDQIDELLPGLLRVRQYFEFDFPLADNPMAMSLSNDLEPFPLDFYTPILDHQNITGDLRLLCYALLGRLGFILNKHERWQMAPILYGEGGTGKTTIAGTAIHAMNGEGSVGIMDNAPEPAFPVQGLETKTAIFMNDIGNGFLKAFSQDRFRTMLNGEGVTVARKFMPKLDIDNWPSAIIITTNDELQWENDKGQMARRLAQFQFVNALDVTTRVDYDSIAKQPENQAKILVTLAKHYHRGIVRYGKGPLDRIFAKDPDIYSAVTLPGSISSANLNDREGAYQRYGQIILEYTGDFNDYVTKADMQAHFRTWLADEGINRSFVPPTFALLKKLCFPSMVPLTAKNYKQGSAYYMHHCDPPVPVTHGLASWVEGWKVVAAAEEPPPPVPAPAPSAPQVPAGPSGWDDRMADVQAMASGYDHDSFAGGCA